MPKPMPVAIRRQIVEHHEKGEPLTKIAARLEKPYESVRNVWRIYRTEGRVVANYAKCGRQEVSASKRVYRGAMYLKRVHPKWGAGLIRQVIADKWPEEKLPHERSMQRWFRKAGIHNQRRQQILTSVRIGRGKTPHNIWEMDSREQIELASKDKVSWFLISDENSGAVLDGHVFPQSTSCSTYSTGDSGSVEK